MPQGTWDPSTLRSYSSVQNYLFHSDAIAQVLNKKDNLCTRSFSPLNANLPFHWNVCQFATTPFRYLVAFVLRTISTAAWAVDATQVKKYFKESAIFFEVGLDVYSQEETHLFNIQETINDYSEEAKSTATNPMIPRAAIADSKLRNKTFDSGIKFDHNGGICRGISEWFIYLYLNTKDQFSDPRSHMRALGKQFADGASFEPALLQSLYTKKGKLLGLKSGIQSSKPRHQLETPLYKIPSAEWRSSKDATVQKLQVLPPGAYKINFPRHATAYVKINDNLGYFFDSNVGIVEINGEAQAEKFYERLLETYDWIVDPVEALRLRNYYIQIIPVTKR